MMCSRTFQLSSAPGFSPVLRDVDALSRFNGFHARWKPLKRLNDVGSPHTGLKPGANESGDSQSEIVNRKS
jgi:hypothetical protein